MNEFGERFRQIQEQRKRQAEQERRVLHARVVAEEQKELAKLERAKQMALLLQPVLEEVNTNFCDGKGNVEINEIPLYPYRQDKSPKIIHSVTLIWNKTDEDSYDTIWISLDPDTSSISLFPHLPPYRDDYGNRERISRPINMGNRNWKSELEKKIFFVVQNDFTHVRPAPIDNTL